MALTHINTRGKYKLLLFAEYVETIVPKLEDALNKLIYPLLLSLLTPIMITLGSQLATGDYMNWVDQIPFIGKVGFVLFIILWLGVILISRRLKAIEPKGITVSTASRWGYEDIATKKYNGVKWRVIAPKPHPASFSRGLDLTPSRIRIRSPPRCPKCETEIEQSKSFWGGYVWKCVRCNWKKRSKESYYRVNEQVEKIVQREMETRESQEE